MEKCLPKFSLTNFWTKLVRTYIRKYLALFLIGLGFFILWYGVDKITEDPQFSPQSPPQSLYLEESTKSASLGIEGERVIVEKVIDGDTVELEDGRKVRYIGIDTPETKDPRRPVECFGKEASFENKKLVEGKIIILQKDISELDKYGRLLRYIYLPLEDGNLLFVQDYLIREGFATALTYPPDVKYTEQFLKAQEQAKLNKKGLWSSC